MPNPSAKDVAAALIQSFDQQLSVLLEEAVLEALVKLGVPQFDAPDIADPRFLNAVRSQFERRRPEELPFDVSLRRPERLVGKKRVRTGDSATTKEIRERIHLVEALCSVLVQFDENEFEHLCAAILLRNGASEAYVTGSSDDGGVDVYGRIPVLVGDKRITPGLVRSSLEVREVLFMAQSKRYATHNTIERGELQKFAGQVRDCLRQYKGISKKPSHRVPESFFVEEELCLPIFMTSSGFSRDARSYADGVNMVLADGRLLAELLVAWGAVPHKTTLGVSAIEKWSAQILLSIEASA